jgi:hypothetical protein
MKLVSELVSFLFGVDILTAVTMNGNINVVWKSPVWLPDYTASHSRR